MYSEDYFDYSEVDKRNEQYLNKLKKFESFSLANKNNLENIKLGDLIIVDCRCNRKRPSNLPQYVDCGKFIGLTNRGNVLLAYDDYTFSIKPNCVFAQNDFDKMLER